MTAHINNQQIDGQKAVSELVMSAAAVVVLIALIVSLLLPLRDDVSNQVGNATTVCFILDCLLIAAMLATIAKVLSSSFSRPDPSVENLSIYKHYLLLKILFNSAVTVFFGVLLIWVGYLRGVLNSPFSAFLCTAPVSLVFIAAKTKHRRFHLPANTVTTAMKGLKFFERLSAAFPVILYLLCVGAVELWLFGFFDRFADNKFIGFIPSLKAGVINADQHAALRQKIGYIVLSYVAFYGSVLSTLATYYTTKEIE